jgi:hypothetical protein
MLNHKDITPGFYFIKDSKPPYFSIIQVFGKKAKLIGIEESFLIENFQFIERVPDTEFLKMKITDLVPERTFRHKETGQLYKLLGCGESFPSEGSAQTPLILASLDCVGIISKYYVVNDTDWFLTNFEDSVEEPESLPDLKKQTQLLQEACEAEELVGIDELERYADEQRKKKSN